jgi:hypothetical protein
VRFIIGTLFGTVLGALLVIGTVGGFLAGLITAICINASADDDESITETPEEVTAT